MLLVCACIAHVCVCVPRRLTWAAAGGTTPVNVLGLAPSEYVRQECCKSAKAALITTDLQMTRRQPAQTQSPHSITDLGWPGMKRLRENNRSTATTQPIGRQLAATRHSGTGSARAGFACAARVGLHCFHQPKQAAFRHMVVHMSCIWRMAARTAHGVGAAERLLGAQSM